MSNVTAQYSNETTVQENDTNQDYMLVEGQFTPGEAKEVLMDLISSKLAFQSKKHLQSYEQQGQLNTSAKQRISELKEMRSKLLELLESAEQQNLVLNIHSEINIELLPARQDPTTKN